MKCVSGMLVAGVGGRKGPGLIDKSLQRCKGGITEAKNKDIGEGVVEGAQSREILLP